MNPCLYLILIHLQLVAWALRKGMGGPGSNTQLTETFAPFVLDSLQSINPDMRCIAVSCLGTYAIAMHFRILQVDTISMHHNPRTNNNQLLPLYMQSYVRYDGNVFHRSLPPQQRSAIPSSSARARRGANVQASSITPCIIMNIHSSHRTYNAIQISVRPRTLQVDVRVEAVKALADVAIIYPSLFLNHAAFGNILLRIQDDTTNDTSSANLYGLKLSAVETAAKLLFAGTCSI